MQSPLIFDDSLDYSDPEESRFGRAAYSDGLMTKTGGGLLSMPAFEKNQKVEFLDSDEASNVLQDTSSFLNCPQASYGTPIFTPILDNSFVSDDDSIHYLSSNAYAGSPFELCRSPSLESHSRQSPEVTSFSPCSGSEGTKISIYVQSLFDLLNPPTWTFSLVFGSLHCDCVIAPIGFQDSSFQYALVADVPAFGSLGSASLSVPLQLVMNDNDTPSQQFARVGSFVYEHRVQEEPSRKRRMSCESDETSASAKHVRVHENLKVAPYNERLSASPYSPYLPTPSSISGYSGQYQQSFPAPQFEGHASLAQTRAKAPSPLASSWSPSVTGSTVSINSPSLSGVHISREPEMPTTVNPPNPTLVRTSTIQQSLAAPSGPGQSQAFNPYAMYPTKAVLKLNGDLDSMTENWTGDERDCQRRLVQFTRRQEGSTIHADFEPVAPADRLPNSICISCIYWAGKDECFVTSVDTIYLLESLVGVRFTVEEKNRIRRNLEGFRPLTVSKAKADSEDYFKVIMGFPNPKPRNIEKDVKVFPWKILAHALKKIISKYSASYSSTASALPGVLGSNYAGSHISDSGVDIRTASPQANPNPSRYSPQSHSQAALTHNAQVSAPNLLPVIVSSDAQHPNLPATYCYPQNDQQHMQPSPVVVPSQNSFDFTAYINHAPMATGYHNA